ncbi:MAG TPA: hypothetical protein VM529_25000 [Gemmata sp.]|jgi:hypothetical protein|nr:hypothetical protein [Gemmata sp.]
MGRPADEFDVHFPKAGMDRSCPSGRQPARAVGEAKEYARTSWFGKNVRAFDVGVNRMRGGSRAGFSKLIDARVNGVSWVVQDLYPLVGTFDELSGGGVQLSLSGRVVRLVGVSQGVVKVMEPGDTAWTATTNNTGETPPLNITGLIYSSANNQDLFFADGINYVYYDPVANAVNTWTPTAGQLPVDSEDNAASLITTWRGRIVLSGLTKDPQNWFMSKVTDPFDWDYSPTSPSAVQAVAGNNSQLGFIGDVVTGLVPRGDDELIFGGDHTLYVMRGDPMAGGEIDLVSDVIGMAWGQAWCKDPYGTVYFMSNRTGVYAWPRGGMPTPISQEIDPLLQQVNMGENIFRLVWNDRYKGVHVFVTPAQASGASTHYFWESRVGAWWTDDFAEDDHNPTCACAFDGNRPDDRLTVIGGWDGYVRILDPDASTDDGEAINSEVWIGPFLTNVSDDTRLDELQAILAEDSGTVTWAVYVGSTAEEARASTAVVSGTWAAGRNLTSYVRRAGHAAYVRITSTNRWAMEQIRVRLATGGTPRKRGDMVR